MAISFTSSIITRLNKEIAELQTQSSNEKRKKEKALAKIKQLQKDSKISKSHSDLSSKMTQIKKLTDEVARITKLQTELTKQLDQKNAQLKQQSAAQKNI